MIDYDLSKFWVCWIFFFKFYQDGENPLNVPPREFEIIIDLSNYTNFFFSRKIREKFYCSILDRVL